MNLVEGLSREIERVTILRESYRALQTKMEDLGARCDTGPAVAMMTAAIEEAHKAQGAGPDNATDVLGAYQVLQGFRK